MALRGLNLHKSISAYLNPLLECLFVVVGKEGDLVIKGVHLPLVIHRQLGQQICT